MMLKLGYASVLVAIAISVFIGWRLSVSEKLPKLSPWRRRLQLLGLFGNAASLIGFLAAIIMILMHNNVADFRSHRIFFPLAVGPIVLGAFGRGAPRVLVIFNGLVLTFLWLNLAASSL